MKLLLSTRKFSLEFSPWKVASLAQRLGFDGIELVLPACPAHDFSAEFYRTLSNVSVVHAPPGLYNQATFRQSLNQAVAVAQVVGADKVNIHPAAFSQGGNANIVDSINYLLEVAGELSDKLCLLYEVLAKPTTPAQAQKQAYPDPHSWFIHVQNFGLDATLDTTHLASWEADPINYAVHLGPRLAHVHVSDYGSGKQHLLLGKGTINFPAFFRVLCGWDRPGFCVTLEPSKDYDLADSGTVTTLQQNLSQMREWLAA